ncbi:MAG: hypothetical protein IT449_13810 [Phycisphaerales bacterium]|nr:hypothetical protein [Phycisphaerales bacterium]
MKWTSFSIKAGLVLVLGVAAWMELGSLQVARLTAQVNALEEEKERLRAFAERLQSSRRAAQLDVVRQYQDAQGRTRSVLVWQEIGKDGLLGRPLAVETIGSQVYVEGRVLKFEPKLLEQPHADEGASLVMFRRLFGDKQTPDSAIELDRATGPPIAPEDPMSSRQQLWDRFWELAENPELAKQFSVRVAQCEAPSVRVRPGQVWEVSLDTAGGLNLRKVAERPDEKVSDADR